MRRFVLICLFVLGVVLAVNVMTGHTDPLKVGTPAPAYTLPDQDGKTHTLAQEQGHVALLAFYPADMTPGCTIEAHELTKAYPDLKKMGVDVFGISVQDPGSHKEFCTKEGIPYTLLADTQKVTTKAYGVLSSGGYANRVTFVIGRDGTIAYVDPDVNGHLFTCGDDWISWFKAHPKVLNGDSARAAAAVLPLGLLLDHAAVRQAVLGRPAPAFALPNVLTGAKTSLAALQHGKKATVVLFIATRCPVSNAYDDRMNALARKYGPLGVAFVGINANQTEPVAECADHARQHGFPFPVLKDATDAVADAYGARVTPEAYVIDAQGDLVYHGRIDNSIDPAGVVTHDLADALDAVLAGKTVAVPQTKAFGCSIKRGDE